MYILKTNYQKLRKDSTDLFDKQQSMKYHRGPVATSQISSSHYGLTSSDEIDKELLPKLKHLYNKHSAGVCQTYLEKETGNLSWTGWARVISFLKQSDIHMQSQLSWAGPDVKQESVSGKKDQSYSLFRKTKSWKWVCKLKYIPECSVLDRTNCANLPFY